MSENTPSPELVPIDVSETYQEMVGQPHGYVLFREWVDKEMRNKSVVLKVDMSNFSQDQFEDVAKTLKGFIEGGYRNKQQRTAIIKATKQQRDEWAGNVFASGVLWEEVF